MECYTCSSRSLSEHGLYCSACARAALYPLRLDHASALLQKERLSHQVQAMLNPPEKQNSIEVHQGAKQSRHEQVLEELAETQEQIDGIVRQSETLRERIEEYKKELRTRKAALAARCVDLTSARAVLSLLRSRSTNSIKKAIRNTNQEHLSLSDEMMSARAYLCTEAALLGGLRQQRHQRANGAVHEAYIIGGVKVMDLRHLNDHTPAEISAALTNVSQLLFLVCYYLGIQLPAELMIPGEQRPLPSIYQVFSSYKEHFMEGSIIATSDVGSFGLSNVQHHHIGVARPRPLWPEHKLPVLAHDDPKQYLKFVQGVVLLAWDIAWLCRTQGLAVATDDWEEVCALGKNLWLLLSPPSTTPKSGPLPEQAPKLQDGLRPSLGLLSHATTRAFLASAASTSICPPSALLRTWALASPVPIIDKLKAFLLAEISGLEWEVLDQGEYKGGEGIGDEPVILEDKIRANGAGISAAGTGEPSSGTRGTSGWTKLRGRPSL